MSERFGILERMTKWLSVSAAMMLVSASASAQVLINEVDANTVGDPDAHEFIELYNPTDHAVSLDPFVLVFFNGATDASYRAYDLDGHSIASGDFFVISGSNINVPNTDMVVSPATLLLQNGADAVALYRGTAADWPNGTPVSTSNLADALVYDVNDPDDAGLLVLLNAGEPQIDEEANGNSAFESMQRCPDGGGGARNTSSYLVDAPTPGTRNNCPCGNGALDSGEDCDDGPQNGTTASCCTASCTYQPVDTLCILPVIGIGACNATPIDATRRGHVSISSSPRARCAGSRWDAAMSKRCATERAWSVRATLCGPARMSAATRRRRAMSRRAATARPRRAHRTGSRPPARSAARGATRATRPRCAAERAPRVRRISDWGTGPTATPTR